jgi:hypothetical protein
MGLIRLGTSALIGLSIYLWLYGPFVEGRLFSFVILYRVGRNPRMGDQPVARPLPTQRTTETQNKHKQTSMPRVGFESTIPMFERAKTLHALDRATIAIGDLSYWPRISLVVHWYRNLFRVALARLRPTRSSDV